jgi:hypothetical protein
VIAAFRDPAARQGVILAALPGTIQVILFSTGVL